MSTLTNASSPSPAHGSEDDARAAALTALEREFNFLTVQIRLTNKRNAQLVSDGMLPAAYKVLTTIARAGTITLSALTEQLMTDKGQMSRTVRELGERGLIDRAPDPSDGRALTLSLSEFGRQRLDQVRGTQDSLLRDAMSDWSVEDIEKFTVLLHALSHGLTP